MKKISQFDRPTGDMSLHDKQILVHMRELAPETDLCNRSKSFVVQHIFSLEIIGADKRTLLPECVAGVCSGASSLVCTRL